MVGRFELAQFCVFDKRSTGPVGSMPIHSFVNHNGDGGMEMNRLQDRDRTHTSLYFSVWVM